MKLWLCYDLQLMAYTKQKRLIFAAVAVLAVVLIAIFTNPNQARHLTAIKETGELRYPDKSALFINQIEYQNYFVFSTSSCLGTTVAYGYFGIVQTTNEIGIVYAELYQH